MQLGNQSACGIVAQANLTAIFPRNIARNGEAKAEAAGFAITGFVGSAERFEHFLDAVGGNAGAVILYAQ